MRAKRQRNGFVYKDESIISSRKGSRVEVAEDSIIIYPDITGIDKVYYSIIGDELMLSSRLKDFKQGIDKRFEPFLKKHGYVPYPYTILKGVYKAPPGIRISFSRKEPSRQIFTASEDLKVFNIDRKFRKQDFRLDFTRILTRDHSGSGMLTCSYSGGFDSMLLLTVLGDRVKRLIHFDEGKKVRKPDFGLPLVEVGQDAGFTEADRKRYFSSVDEPNCDPSGFAEYLLVKAVRSKDTTILNGQGADALFANGNIYFHDHVSQKVPGILQEILPKRVRHYAKGTTSRFYSYYAPDLPMDAYPRFNEIFNIYRKSIYNDSTNFLAAMIYMLKYSLHGIEKIRQSAHANKVKYYLPFNSLEMLRFAFSIPARHKIGRKQGKRILTESFPEVRGYSTGAFRPMKLRERFVQGNVRYEEYFYRRWKR